MTKTKTSKKRFKYFCCKV